MAAVNPADGIQVLMSSSPLLPPVSQLLSGKPLLASDGDNVDPVPDDLMTGFTCVSKLLRNAQKGETLENNININSQAPSERVKLPDSKPAVFKRPMIELDENVLSNEENTTPPRESSEKASHVNRVLNPIEEPGGPPTTSVGNIPKKRRNGGLQSKLKMGKITKVGVGDDRNREKTGLVKDVGSSKGTKKAASEVAKKAKSKNVSDKLPDMLLAEAVKRRKSWTPVKDTRKPVSPSKPIETQPNFDCHSNQDLSNPLQTPRFDALIDLYKCVQQSDRLGLNSQQVKCTVGEVVAKRQKIELINPPSLVSVAPSKKLKAPKKKPRTITDKATASYTSAEPSVPVLSQYFDAPTKDKVQEHSTGHSAAIDVLPDGPTKRKQRAKASKTARTPKKNQKSITLLSPETAIRSTSNQELMFGTSSQLAHNKSPICAKYIHQITDASGTVMDRCPITSDRPENLACDLKSADGRSTLSTFAASKNLWSIAARDLNGSLLSAEIIDLVDTPMPQKPQVVPTSTEFETKQSPSKSLIHKEQVTTVGEDSVRVELGQNDISMIAEENFVLEQPIPRSIAEASLRQRRKSRSPVKRRDIDKNLNTASLNAALGQAPNYNGFTTAQLAKEVASYGFKAIKKRTEMIGLLERCWESQSRIALQALSTNANLLQPSGKSKKSESPKKKNSSKSKLTLSKGEAQNANEVDTSNAINAPKLSTEEITFSSNATSKNLRGRPRKQDVSTSNSNPSPPIPTIQEPTSPTLLSESIPKSTPPPSSLSRTPLSSLPSLQEKITQAITTFPPTHSATSPSFYERMLLYEPIVLENLTAWLNTKGLGTVGVDEEVSPDVVKEWCEKRGVCCFWKAEGWRVKR